MLHYVRNFGVKNYCNRTTILQLIANNISGFFSDTRCKCCVELKLDAVMLSQRVHCVFIFVNTYRCPPARVTGKSYLQK